MDRNILIFLALGTLPLLVNGQLKFDCRRKDYNILCVAPSTCNTETGNCDCPVLADPVIEFNDYLCNIITKSQACPGCLNGGTCGLDANNAPKCFCAEGYYGADCSIMRALTYCSNDNKMFISVNPYADPFQGEMFVQGQQNVTDCNLADFNPGGTYDNYIENPDLLDGLYLELPNTGSPCGDAVMTQAADGSATFYDRTVVVRYDLSLQSSVDLHIKFRCVVTNGTAAVGGSMPTIDANNAINPNIPSVDVEGQVQTVLMQIVNIDDGPIGGLVLLAQPIKLLLTMVQSPTYADFIVTKCTANNTVEGTSDDYKYIDFVVDSCPSLDSLSVFSGAITKNTVTTGEEGAQQTTITINIPLKAFLFVGSSSQVSFLCEVALCEPNDLSTCTLPTSCAGVSSNPGNSGDSSGNGNENNGNENNGNENNGNSGDSGSNIGGDGDSGNGNSGNGDETTTPPVDNTPPPGKTGRRKREANQREGVSASMTVLDPESLNELRELKQAVEAKDCMNDPGIKASIVILSIAVALLLALSAILVLRLLNRGAKVESSRPVQGQTPMETMRIPRLEFSQQGQGC